MRTAMSNGDLDVRWEYQLDRKEQEVLVIVPAVVITELRCPGISPVAVEPYQVDVLKQALSFVSGIPSQEAR